MPTEAVRPAFSGRAQLCAHRTGRKAPVLSGMVSGLPWKPLRRTSPPSPAPHLRIKHWASTSSGWWHMGPDESGSILDAESGIRAAWGDMSRLPCFSLYCSLNGTARPPAAHLPQRWETGRLGSAVVVRNLSEMCLAGCSETRPLTVMCGLCSEQDTPLVG
uniref:Uncharacterized protein n=1 Tax=Myotis myotis TaxID=51298 RepID=A0A7J7UCZ1_MYOMY|nr:hypothetical protein mMyoMyo1_008788 [Myotis myotis]